MHMRWIAVGSFFTSALILCLVKSPKGAHSAVDMPGDFFSNPFGAAIATVVWIAITGVFAFLLDAVTWRLRHLPNAMQFVDIVTGSILGLSLAYMAFSFYANYLTHPVGVTVEVPK